MNKNLKKYNYKESTYLYTWTENYNPLHHRHMNGTNDDKHIY